MAAACLVETARLSYRITDLQHFHVQTDPMDSTTKKRQFNRSHTFHSNNQLTKIIITDNSCSSQAVTTDNIQPSKICP